MDMQNQCSFQENVLLYLMGSFLVLRNWMRQL